ncbi:MAG: hypothetical protein ACRDFC_06495, partial [Ignavibacteria bacterium]
MIPGLLLSILMVRSASEPYLNWSNPQTLSNLLSHIMGSDFSQLMFSSSSTFSANLKLFFGGVLNEFAIVPGIVGAAGLILLYMLNKNIFFYFLILILTCLLFSFNYNTKEIQSFFLVIYFIIPMCAGIGLVFALNFINQKLNFGKSSGLATTTAACFFLCGFSLIYHYKANDNSDNYIIEDLTLNTLNQLEPNSIVITYDWGYLYSGSLYYQQVEKIRADLKIFIVKFLSAPWYLETIKKYYADVYNNCKNEIEEYIKSYGGNENLRIQRLNALVKAFISKNFGKFNIYLTFDFVYNKETKGFISD